MSKLIKVFALAIVVAFIASTPLALAQTQPDVIQFVLVLKHESNFVKPGGGGSGGSSGGDYKIWFRGYQTDVPVDLTVYTANSEGLQGSFIVSAVNAAVDTWDAATTVQFKGTITTSSGTGTVKQDNHNIITFGNYPQSGVIAVTYAWVDRANYKLKEFDIMLDTDFTWGDAASSAALVMDVQNILTHELGHGFNLSDLYAVSKSALTMYGYSTEGDVEKRTLEPGDVAGIQAIYGV